MGRVRMKSFIQGKMGHHRHKETEAGISKQQIPHPQTRSEGQAKIDQG